MENFFLTSELRSTKDIWFSVLNGFAQAYPGMSNFTQSYKKAIDFLSVDWWWKLFKMKSESIKIFSWLSSVPRSIRSSSQLSFQENIILFSDYRSFDELFLRNGWPTKGVYALLSAGTVVRDSHHRKSLTRREEDLNLRFVQ